MKLRLANARAHLALDPDTYRVPQRGVVARHFATVLTDRTGRNAVLVAETPDGRVVGMVEVLHRPEPPKHQILRPEPTAEVHTVVLDDARGEAVGSALLDAAERRTAGGGRRSRLPPQPSAHPLRAGPKHGTLSRGMSRPLRQVVDTTSRLWTDGP